MLLLELNKEQKSHYNSFVAEAGGSFLQSWEWGDWQKTLGHTAHRFCLTDDGGRWLLAGQFLVAPLLRQSYYLYAPYGPVAAPNSEFRIPNFEFLTQELQKRFPEAVFIRIEPTSINFLRDLLSASHHPRVTKSANIQPAITMVVDVGGRSEAELFAAMHPKTRYNIRLAQKHGVEVHHELVVTPQHGLYAGEAVDLIIQTQQRQSYRGHSKTYYKNLIDFFAMQNFRSAVRLHMYRATFQRQLLACGIMVDFGKTRVYLYGGSSEDRRDVMAPYLLHWQAMRDAQNLGLAGYDLGGSEVAGGGERGFTRFKRGFGGRVVEYAGAYDVPSNKTWYTIYKGLRRFNRILKKITK